MANNDVALAALERLVAVIEADSEGPEVVAIPAIENAKAVIKQLRDAAVTEALSQSPTHEVLEVLAKAEKAVVVLKDVLSLGDLSLGVATADRTLGDIRDAIATLNDRASIMRVNAATEALSSNDVALLPCPFCGGRAERFTIEDESDEGNFGGDVIQCTRCQASSHVEFGRKENLVDRWNTRTEALSSQDKIREVRGEDVPAEVSEMQAGFQNPVHLVAFRAGFILCREYMARFVDHGGDTVTAQSIRANWIPALGDDPGGPRRYDFSEVVQADDMENGPWSSKNPGICVEAAVYALCAMSQFGMELPALASQKESGQ